MLPKRVLLVSLFCALFHDHSFDTKSTIDFIINDAPWRLKVTLLKNNRSRGVMDRTPNVISEVITSRRVGIEALAQSHQFVAKKYIIKRRQATNDTTLLPEHNHRIKMKLFDMMYKLKSDTNKQARRAEMIREKYASSGPFDIGVLVGEVEDLYKWMIKFSETIRHYNKTWAAIEHLNAYEHIENYAVQINYIIDIAKSAHDRG